MQEMCEAIKNNRTLRELKCVSMCLCVSLHPKPY